MPPPPTPEVFQQLKTKIATDKDEVWVRQKDFLNDECLTRYLIAFGKVDKAKDQLKKTVKWRDEAHPERLIPASFPESVQTMYMYWNGHDKHGHPILYIRSRNHDTALDRDRRCAFALSMLETGIKLMQPQYSGREGVDKWIILVDEAGKTGKNNDLKLLRKLGPLMFAHYVERLYKLFIVNPSSTLNTMVRLVGMFIDDHTKSKLVLSKHDAEKSKKAPPVSDAALDGDDLPDEGPASPGTPFDLNMHPELIADIGVENLEVTYGGKRPCPSPAEVLDQLQTLYA